MKRLKAILPHVCIILSLMFMVFLVLDDYNPMMNFLTNPISTALLALLCIVGMLSSILSIRDRRKSEGAIEYQKIAGNKVLDKS